MNFKKNIDNLTDNLYEKYRDDNEKLIRIQNIIENIENTLCKDDLNKEKKKKIEIFKKEIFKKFFDIYSNKYFYLKNNNVFYIYDNADFKIINSDLILFKLKDYLPFDLEINKTIFYKNFLDEMKKNHIFNMSDENINKISLEKKTILHVKYLFKKVLGSMINVDYVLNYISCCINDIDYDNNINLFYGKSAVGFIQFIKNIISEYIRPCPKNIQCIKYSYNNYDFDKLNIIKFSDKSFESLKEFKEFKYNKPKIAITLFYYSNIIKPYKLNKIKKSDIFYLQKYEKKESYLKKIIEENIEITDNGIIKIKELYMFVNKIISDRELPSNIYSYNDIIDYMEKYYKDFIDSKHVYRGISLKELNKYNIFKEFSDENIINNKYGIIRIRELYESFKIWYNDKYDYVSFPHRIDIKNYMDNIFKEYLDPKDNSIYYGISLIRLNKNEIISNFLKKCTNQSDNSYTKMPYLFDTFKIWYGINYKDNSENSLYPNRQDIQYILSNYYKYEKYKGWKGLKIKNIFMLNNEDIKDIKKEIINDSVIEKKYYN